MNWLAHFHFLPTDAHALAATGTALADLGHDLAPKLRGPVIVEALSGAGEDEGGLAAGARHHLASDAIFHDHPEVTGRMTAVRLRLHAPEFAELPRRREFVAHVLVELALDAALHARDRELPARLAAALAHPHRARAHAALGRSLPAHAGNAAESLEQFAGRIHFLQDSSPPALARRLGRTLVHRLKMDPNTVPERALADLIEETTAGLETGLPELEQALAAL